MDATVVITSRAGDSNTSDCTDAKVTHAPDPFASVAHCHCMIEIGLGNWCSVVLRVGAVPVRVLAGRVPSGNHRPRRVRKKTALTSVVTETP